MGANAGNGSAAGLFYLNSDFAVGASGASVGTRLLYIP
nr:MAG: hypothetical protein [Bacteriophage sp.]